MSSYSMIIVDIFESEFKCSFRDLKLEISNNHCIDKRRHVWFRVMWNSIRRLYHSDRLGRRPLRGFFKDMPRFLRSPSVSIGIFVIWDRYFMKFMSTSFNHTQGFASTLWGSFTSLHDVIDLWTKEHCHSLRIGDVVAIENCSTFVIC